jgi:O-antigen/teichoic acid export membrane protein
VVSVAAARFLGPSNFGRQSFIAFVEISTIYVLSAGIPNTIARFVADALGRGDPAFALRLNRWGWRIETGGAIGGTTLLVGVALAGGSPRAAWLFAAVAAASTILARVPTSLLAGIQLWRVQTLVGLSIGAVATIVTVAVLAAGFGITGMFAVEAATGVAGLLLFSLFARRAATRIAAQIRAAQVSDKLGGDVFRFAALTSVNVLFMLVIWRRSDLFFLQHFSSAKEMGFYSIAFVAATAPGLVFTGLTGALGPALATLHGAGAIDRVRTGFSRSLRLLLMIALPMTAIAFALGPPLVRLVYGREYSAVGPVLIILLVVLPITPLYNLTNALLSAMGRVRFLVVVNVIASAANILLDLLLVPGHGAIGAALASGTAQMIIALPMVIYVSKTLGRVGWESAAIARTAVAAALAGLAAWACVSIVGSVAGVAIGVIVGPCTFFLLAGPFRILLRSDADWLNETVGNLLGGLPGRVIRYWTRPSTGALGR